VFIRQQQTVTDAPHQVQTDKSMAGLDSALWRQSLEQMYEGPRGPGGAYMCGHLLPGSSGRGWFARMM